MKYLLLVGLLFLCGCSPEKSKYEFHIGDVVEELDASNLQETQQYILSKIKPIWESLEDSQYSVEFKIQKSSVSTKNGYTESEVSSSIVFKFAKQIESIDYCYQVNYDGSLSPLFKSEKLDWASIESLLKSKNLLGIERLKKL